MNLLTTITEEFTAQQAKQPSNNLQAVTQKAYEAYTRMGIPTSRHEEWKYTRLSGVLNKDYNLHADVSYQIYNTPNLLYPELRRCVPAFS